MGKKIFPKKAKGKLGINISAVLLPLKSVTFTILTALYNFHGIKD